MHYSPRAEICPLPYSPFKSCTVPRPIGWLSTRSEKGIDNLAPYSQWQNISFDPPIVMFSAQRNGDGSRKDTVVNAEALGWFVWNMASYELKEAVNISAMELGPDIDEFERASVGKLDCLSAPCARVAESPVHFECRVIKMLTFEGKSPQGTADVVFGEVEQIHIDDKFLTKDGKLDVLKIRPISRLGYYDYTSITDIFEMQIPQMEGALASGLEGRPSR